MEIFVKSFRKACGLWLIHEQTLKKCLILNWNKIGFKLSCKYFARKPEITSKQLLLSDQSQLEYCMCTNRDINLQHSKTAQRSLYKLLPKTHPVTMSIPVVHFPLLISTVQGHLVWVKMKCFLQGCAGERLHWENFIPLYRQDVYYFASRTIFFVKVHFWWFLTTFYFHRTLKWIISLLCFQEKLAGSFLFPFLPLLC